MPDAPRRFKIGDTTYDLPSLDTISLKDMLVFEKETADLGIPTKWAAVEAGAGREGEQPDVISVAAMVWLARRNAGEAITFEQAIDFPLSSFTQVANPEDRKRPTKRKPSTRRVSEAADDQPEVASLPQTSTSSATSASA